ncbi:MAG: 50S ribosomal protein L11 methyltransferase [Gammaproteobacteria bacterium]|nr:50S ribosomal protein L11 methyltransferase [Gammaproteobacteria bacterium]
MTAISGNPGWVKIYIDCLSEQADLISAVLEDSGALSVSTLVSDSKRTGVEALYSPDFEGLPSVQAEVEKFRSKDQNFQVTQTLLADRDWVGESQQNLEPVEVGQYLRIIAPWHDISEDDRMSIIINPGTSFGTGHHETTWLCAKLLSGLELKGCSVIDYGCGSGVLAIAALQLGAEFAWGIDIDPDALTDSRDNAVLNGVDGKYRCSLPAELPNSFQADIVVANIFADALVGLSDELIRLTRPNGWLILSGILQSQISQVCNAFAHAFSFSVEYLGDWGALVGQREENSN